MLSAGHQAFAQGALASVSDAALHIGVLLIALVEAALIGYVQVLSEGLVVFRAALDFSGLSGEPVVLL